MTVNVERQRTEGFGGGACAVQRQCIGFGQEGITKHKGASVPWEWGIKCGLCENVTQVSVDRATKGRIQRFRRGKEFENLKTSCRKIIFYAIDGAPQGNSKSHFHAGFCVQITPQNV